MVISDFNIFATSFVDESTILFVVSIFLVMQFPFSKYLSGDMHEVQCELVSSDGPSHVLQSEWHFSHLLSTVYVEFGQVSTHLER